MPEQNTESYEENRMNLKTIAILSPGDMGHGVGKVLSEHGYDVITCLAGTQPAHESPCRIRWIQNSGNP